MDLFSQNTAEALPDAKTDLAKTASEAYYNTGETILKDSEYDLLADNGLDIDSRNFRKKTPHNYLMGSLNKHKQAESLARWVRKFPGATLVVMPKLDGNSMGLKVADRLVFEVATRGDGRFGNDVTGNALFTRLQKVVLPDGFPADNVDLRAEAIISKEYESMFEKNLRNVASGRLNAKDPQEDVLALIDFLIFDIYGNQFQSWNQRKAGLLAFPEDARTPFVELTDVNPDTLYADLETYFEEWKQGKYKIDGLVVWAITDPDGLLPEPELKPADKVAVKYGSEEADTEVVGIDWTLGQHDRIVPTLILKPVELDGTTVQRASASNFKLLQAAGLGLGAQVAVQKAGDIIPYVTEIYETSEVGVAELPKCPDCDTQSVLSASGVDAICPNNECEGKTKVKLQKAFAIFGIDFIGDSTIDKLVDNGFDSLAKIFALKPDDLVKLDGFAQKSANYLVRSLTQITLTEPLVIKLVGLRGIGERKGGMLLDHYGSLDTMIASVRERGLDDIPNFGPKQGELLERRIDEFEAMLSTLREFGITVTPYQKAAPMGEGGMVICCTGTCPGLTRNQLADKLAEHGHSFVDRVTSDTQMLLCADPSGNSSKLKKARDKGLPIKGYEEFLSTLGA